MADSRAHLHCTASIDAARVNAHRVASYLGRQCRRRGRRAAMPSTAGTMPTDRSAMPAPTAGRQP